MLRFAGSIVLATLVAFAGRRAAADEQIAGIAGDPPAVIDPAVQRLSDYLYIEFPRRWQALENGRQLAEAEVLVLQRRVDSYRPFRSFHQYSPTYTADMSWQLELLAAQQRLQCIANAEADLWRERQAVAAQFAR
jgi:hypothetical protein